MAKYWVGTTLRHTITFYDTDGATPIDPTVVKLRIRAPHPADQEQVLEYGIDNELVKDGVGIYHIDVTYALAGRHRRRWEASGNISVIYEEWTRIEASAFNYLYEATPSPMTVGSPQLQTPTLTEN